MSKRNENEKDFKSVSYFRLLKCCKPYWFRLTIGIVAGLVVGGSLFGSMMMIPNMLMIVDQDSATRQQLNQTAARIVEETEKPGLTAEEKEKAVAELLHPSDNDPKLTKAMNELRKYSEKLGLPVHVGKTSIEVEKPFEFSFPVVDSFGRITWQFFAIYVVLFILIWTLKNIATFVNHYFTRWVGARVITDMRNDIYQCLLGQSLKFYGKQDIGHLISRCTNDTSAIESSVSDTIADATRCPIEIVACAAAIITASWNYGNYGLLLLLFIGMPACVLPIIILARKIRKIYKKSFAKIADILSRMHETFTGIMIIKAYNTEKHEMNVFRRANDKYFRAVIHATFLQLMMQPLMEVVAIAATLIFLLYSYSKGVNITEMLVILTPAILAYRPIKDLAKVVSHLQRSMAAADRYFALIDTDTSIKEDPHPVELKQFERGIEFRDVRFAYEDKQILNGISFRIPKGSMVAVVGQTGSGKTTIANLIARFYDVNSGEVLIDDIPVRKYSIKSLRAHIGIVTQDPILFNDTIANNISYGCRDVSREDIVLAAKQANAHDFIVDGRHREGYDTEVGEKGCKLSGGEKQRVAIARAILKNPPILILDEATSALDTVTEKLVQDALNRVMSNRTVFAIAHRLSTIQHADLIIVLDKGHIVESGTHAELLARGGRYKRLHDTQFAVQQNDGI